MDSGTRADFVSPNDDKPEDHFYSLLPIAGLSVDLLIIIFKLSDEFWIKPGSQQRHNSQVCRHWREIILASPSLWRFISVDLPLKWLHEIVRRSADTPLHLSARIYSGNQENLDFLLGYAPRFQHFSLLLDADRKDLLRARRLSVWSAFGQPMPFLESFTVLGSGDITPTDLRAAQRGFCGGHAPRLRTLTLSSFWTLGCISPCLSNLRELRLSNVPQAAREGAVGVVPSSSDWVRALSNMPLLEIIHIDHAISNQVVPESSMATLPTVCLPNLVDFRLAGGRISSYIDILSHLTLPCLKQLSIESMIPGNYSQYEKLGHLLYHGYRLPPSASGHQALPTLVFNFHSTRRWFQFVLYKADPDRLSISFGLVWETQTDMLPIFHFLNNFYNLSEIHMIQVDLEPSYFTEEFTPHVFDFLAKLDGVTHLTSHRLGSLVCLCKLIPYGSLFPLLRGIVFPSEDITYDEEGASTWILRFLRSRQDISGQQKLSVNLGLFSQNDAFKREVDQMHWVKADWVPPAFLGGHNLALRQLFAFGHEL